MNKAIKVLLINVAIVLGITLMMIGGFGSTGASDFMIGLGLVSLAVAGLDLFIALVLFLAGKENYEVAKGFLLSSGVLFLLGFAACSFTPINFN